MFLQGAHAKVRKEWLRDITLSGNDNKVLSEGGDIEILSMKLMTQGFEV